ncbi:MAG: ABC transporter permease [Dehalobacterium sp.]
MFNALFLLLLVLFIGSVYQKGVLRQMDLMVVDLDQTSTSRLVTRQFAESEKFRVSFAGGYGAATEALKKGHAVAAVVIPAGLTEAVKSKQGGEILLLVDGTNYIIANSVYSKANEILLSINGGIALKTLAGLGFLPDEAAQTVQSLNLEQKILFNPSYNYSYYLSYGLCGAGIFSLAMSAFALSLLRSTQEKRIFLKELAAKTTVFCLFIFAVINLLFFLLHMVFGLPAAGSLAIFFPLTMGYSLLIAAFGIILLCIVRRAEQIFQLGIFFATTLFFTTGYTWPFQSVPEIMKPLYFINPLTPFVNGVRACLVMGAGWDVMGRYILWQLALSAVYLSVGFLLSYRRRYRYLKE